MPRYFFDVHDGVDSLDGEGTLLDDVYQARAEAAKMAGKLLSDDAERFWTGEEWQIVVRDGAGLTLFTLIFSTVDPPAVISRASSAQF